MLALELYEAGVHKGGCGFHESLATDRNNLFQPAATYCPLCAQVAQMDRLEGEKDRKAREKAGKEQVAALPSDGRRISIRMLSPLEAAQRRQRQPAAEQTTTRP